jgi:hypothetical protein
VSAAPEIEGGTEFQARNNSIVAERRMEWPARALFAVLLGGIALGGTFAARPISQA